MGGKNFEHLISSKIDLDDEQAIFFSETQSFQHNGVTLSLFHGENCTVVRDKIINVMCVHEKSAYSSRQCCHADVAFICSENMSDDFVLVSLSIGTLTLSEMIE